MMPVSMVSVKTVKAMRGLGGLVMQGLVVPESTAQVSANKAIS